MPPNQIRASHILIKHKGSRRLASWKDPNGDVIKKTTPQQAEAKLAALREKIVSGQADFATLARTESDCGSAKEGGDLGYFGPNQMQKPFEEAAFALEIGGLSGIVQSDSGAHIILRTG